MRASQFFGLHLMPLLARLALAAAFIPMGWNKFFQIDRFEGADAARLRELGVGADSREEVGLSSATIAPGGWSLLATTAPPPASRPASPLAAPPADGPRTAPPVSPPAAVPPPAREPGTPPAAEPATPPAPRAPALPPGNATPPAETVPPEAVPAPAAPPIEVEDILVAAPFDDSPLEVRRLHGITLIVDRAGWSSPHVWAYVAAATELLGGALLMIGLFSRIWGFGLAITMAVAFATTTFPVLAAMPPATALVDVAQPPYDLFNRAFAQIGLMLLALLVALAGPGAASLDRLIFRPAEVDSR